MAQTLFLQVCPLFFLSLHSIDFYYYWLASPPPHTHIEWQALDHPLKKQKTPRAELWGIHQFPTMAVWKTLVKYSIHSTILTHSRCSWKGLGIPLASTAVVSQQWGQGRALLSVCSVFQGFSIQSILRIKFQVISWNPQSALRARQCILP